MVIYIYVHVSVVPVFQLQFHMGSRLAKPPFHVWFLPFCQETIEGLCHPPWAFKICIPSKLWICCDGVDLRYGSSSGIRFFPLSLSIARPAESVKSADGKVSPDHQHISVSPSGHIAQTGTRSVTPFFCIAYAVNLRELLVVSLVLAEVSFEQQIQHSKLQHPSILQCRRPRRPVLSKWKVATKSHV